MSDQGQPRALAKRRLAEALCACGVVGSALGERKEGELSKGVLDLLYRYRQ
jgi:hypothetical protein